MPPLETVLGENADVVHDTDFQMLLFATTMTPLGVAIMSPLLDSLIDPFGVTTVRIGLIMSAFTAPSVLFIPLTGIVADRYGRKPLLVGGLLLFGVAGTAIVLTTDFEVVLGLRLCQGLGFAAFLPIVVTSIGDIYQGPQEATAQGVRVAVSGFAQALFPLVAGLLAVFAWQYPFLLYALAVPIALLVAVRFDESHPDSDPGATSQEGLSLRRLLAERRVLTVLLARTIPPFLYVGFLTYNSILVVRLLGASAGEAGVVVAIASLVLATGSSQAGRVTAWFDSRLRPLVVANLLMAVGLGVVAAAVSVSVVVAGVLSLGLGFGLLVAFYRSIITGLAPPAVRGGLVSVSEAAGRLASTTSPLVFGAVIGAATPLVGFETALRVTLLGIGAVGGAFGVGCVLLISASPPVTTAE
jgi:MFS family permease